MISKIELVKELAGLADTLIKTYGRNLQPSPDTLPRRDVMPAPAPINPSDPYAQVYARTRGRLHEAAAERQMLVRKIDRARADERTHLANAQARIERAGSVEEAERDALLVQELSEADHLRRDITRWEAELAEAEDEVAITQHFLAALDATRRQTRSEMASLRHRSRAAARARQDAGDLAEATRIERLIREQLIPAIDDAWATATAGRLVEQSQPGAIRLLGSADLLSDRVRAEIHGLFRAR